MRGADGMQEPLFTMSRLEEFVPWDHPLRAIQVLVNDALARLNDLFNEIYADTVRASVEPEKLMRALLLQVFYSVRSERRLLEHAVVERFFTEVMRLADAKGLLSAEHFTIDGKLMLTWASHKSFRPKD